MWGRGSGMRVGAARSVMGRHGEENVGREAAECGVEVTWSVTGQRGKVQVGREVVDDASGCERGGMMVRDGGRKKLVSPHPTELHSGEGCKLRSLGMLQSVFGASVKLLSSQPNIFLKTTISQSFTDQFPLQCGLSFFAFLLPKHPPTLSQFQSAHLPLNGSTRLPLHPPHQTSFSTCQ